jgi:hypothetical protein
LPEEGGASQAALPEHEGGTEAATTPQPARRQLRRKVTVNLPDEVVAALEDMERASGISKTEVLRRAVQSPEEVWLPLLGPGGLLSDGDLNVSSELERSLQERYRGAEEKKSSYAEQIERAKGDDVFKYLLLIDVSALESYVTQTRLQAEKSFQLSRLIAFLGFSLLLAAVALGAVSQLVLTKGLQVAYIATASGAITEFIAGVVLYLYNKTIGQINLFHTELQSSRRMAVALLLRAGVKDAAIKDAATVELAKSLLTKTGEERERAVGRGSRERKGADQRSANSRPRVN